MAKKRTTKRPAARRAAKVKRTAVSTGLNLGALEKEVKRLTDLLTVIKQKSALVRRSLAYLDREQKKVMRQINQARRFLMRLKNRGLKVWQKFPNNAEDLYRQLKAEFNRLSRRLIPQ